MISQVHAQDSPYLTRILASAHQIKLHEDPYWHILLHYKPGVSGYKSLVDDPRYFLAPDGKTNPENELDATIRAFFEPQGNEEESAVCRFVARYEWIRERLNLDPEQLPITECRSFENFINKVKPESVTLIFPSAHLNSPASMFGHTLMTIETANKSKLLAYAVNYTAVTSESFGPLFAVKGLFGLYPGYFSVLPYYTKLQEYSDVDHRDIWEYQLNLTGPEIRKMMLHIREMDAIASDYYFFDENCSYDLLFLLEAARPNVKLTDQVHGWLIPLDSIRMVEREGLITGVSYRPSRTTKIKYLASYLSVQGQDRALELANREFKGNPFPGGEIPDQEKIKALDLASEYLQYLYTKRKVPQDIYQARLLKILSERSLLGKSGDDSSSQIPAPVQPDKGHESNRFVMGVGVKRDEGFTEVKIRPAYHDLMDCDDGYVEGAQLIFTEAAFRYYPSDRRFILEALDLIDIVSLSPRDKFFRPISWKVKTGLTRMTLKDDKDHLVYEVNPGGGFAYKSDAIGLIYTMLETDLKVSGALKNDYAAGAGGSAGIMRKLSNCWKTHLFVKGLSYGLGDRFNTIEASIQQSFTINANQGITLDVARRKTREFYQTQAKVLWNLFF